MPGIGQHPRDARIWLGQVEVDQTKSAHRLRWAVLL